MKNPQQLHIEFVRLAGAKRNLENRLVQMLPEIYASGIWKKYAKDIEEYAGRFGDIGGSTVRKRLNLEKYVEDKPHLKEAIGKVGVHKVVMLATIATVENEEALADKVLHMSKSAIETLSKELRQNDGQVGQPCHAVAKILSIDLDEEMPFLFLKFKKKFKNLSNKEVMRKLLEEAEQPAKPAKLITGDEKSIAKTKSRYIPAALRRQTIGKGQCQYPNCNRPYNHLHHPERFAKVRNHEKLVALCTDHHEFMHNGLIENEAQQHPTMNIHKKPDEIDLLYRNYR